MGIPSLSLEGKTALVTGAASVRGLGRAIALTLAGGGADGAVCDLRGSGGDFDLEGTAAEIRKLGRRSLAVQADLTKEKDVASLFQKVVQEFGKLDILVNNAGLSAHHTLLQMPTDLWDKAIEVNLKAPFLCSQAAARIMVEQKSGVIVNIASISGLRIGSASVYGIAKAGVMVLTGWGAGAGGAPLGRRGEAADIADVALFLASDAARYITGQTIVVDGGVMVT